jgi:c-di-GMP-binding flagellar brake protein YcgR
MRKHKRVPLASSATISFEENGEIQVLRALSSDVALSGMGIYLERALPDKIGVMLEINFRAAGGIVKTDIVKGNVVYSNYIQDIYFIGIEFVEELSSENQPDLHDRIQNILKWE